MEHDGEAVWIRAGPPPQGRRPGPRWPLIGGLALALALALGVGIVAGSTLLSSAQAASLTPGGATNAQAATNAPFQAATNGPGSAFGARNTLASTPGPQGQGQCESYTVSSVSGNAITAKAADGGTVTIHTTSSTQYRKNGQSAAASDVTAGARISVMGTHNSDGSVTATSIDIG